MAFGDEILAMLKAVKEAEPIKRTRCPECDWVLKITEDGILFCEFCGWSEGLGGKE